MTSPTPLTPRTQRHARHLTEVPPPGRYLAFADGDTFRLVPLTAELIRIGRGLAADIGLDDGQVSRRHALILNRDGRHPEVIDERSRNGTYVNGHIVDRRQTLHHGDAIRVGSTYLVYIEVVALPTTQEFDVHEVLSAA